MHAVAKRKPVAIRMHPLFAAANLRARLWCMRIWFVFSSIFCGALPVQPDGTPAVANAATLGLFFGVDF